MTPGPVALAALEAARAAEREQTIYYRALAGLAEEGGDAAAAERINGLLADEQHHFSRLSARMMEVGHAPTEAPIRGNRTDGSHGGSNPAATALNGWESVAREREHAEIERYESMLRLPLDDRTRAMIDEILASERRHARELGGKWMGA
ncbi:MAG: ferritin-like domain-containing protein [Longimicrobiales bacterium]